MKKLKEFEIYYRTKFGLALFTLKAKSFEDAFNRLKPKYKNTLIEIYNIELNETFYPTQF